MNMTLASNQLEAFFAVARTGNFTKAAEGLHVTQSALSQRILNLEHELGTTLFIRDRAGIRLTETAQKLMRFCQTKNDLEADFLSSLKSKDALVGIVRIGGFSSVMRSVALPALAPFLTKHPEIQLQSFTREMHELLPLLKSGEVDFILSDFKFDREEIESVWLGSETNVLVEAKGYQGPDIYLDHDPKDEITKKYLKHIGKKVSSLRRRYLDDVYGLLEGVKLGLGRAVLPRHLIEGERDLRVLNSKKSLQTEVYLNYFRQPFYSKLHQSIVTELTQQAGRLLAKNKT